MNNSQITNGIPLDMEDSNVKNLSRRIQCEYNFLIRGHSGWGKTAIIEKVAKAYGYEVHNIFSGDAARFIDCIFNKNEPLAHPYYDIYTNPNKKHLIIFDNLQTGEDALWNSIRHLVQDKTIHNKFFSNFLVICVITYDPVNPVSNQKLAMLNSCLDIPIEWNDRTPEAWHSAFKYLHQKWDSTLGSDTISYFEKHATFFNSPLTMDKFILESLESYSKIKEEGDEDLYEVIFDELKRSTEEGITRPTQQDLTNLTQYIYNWSAKK